MLLLSASFVFGQKDLITFKDGKQVPGRSLFIKNCVEGAREKASDRKKKDLEGLCTCMLNVIASEYTYDEFLENADHLGDAIADPKSPVYKGIQKCTGASDEVMAVVTEGRKEEGKTGDSNDLYAGNEFKSGFITTCEKTVKDNAELNGQIDGEKYCACVYDKMASEKMPLSKVTQMQDHNSPEFNRIIVPCLEMAMLPNKQTPVASVGDVIGDQPKEEIPLTSLMGVHRVMVKIDTIEKFYVLDSGAEDVFINEPFEKKLLKLGVIKKSDYLSDRQYLMANGTKITTRRVMIDGFHLGSYTINKVVVAISPDENSFFLLGKSLLNKFSHFSIDNQRKVLTLEK